MTKPERTHVHPGSVALTFDDGPDPRWTPMVLDELARAETKATFFVISGTHPDLLRRIVAEGHEVGYHCGRHIRHSERDAEEVSRELAQDLEWMSEEGIQPQAWRTPWGDLAPWSTEVATDHGLELWGWSDDTRDWSGLASREMLGGLEATLASGSVILMHDGIGPGALREGARETVDLIAPLIQLCRRRGLDPLALRANPAPEPTANYV